MAQKDNEEEEEKEEPNKETGMFKELGSVSNFSPEAKKHTTALGKRTHSSKNQSDEEWQDNPSQYTGIELEGPKSRWKRDDDKRMFQALREYCISHEVTIDDILECTEQVFKVIILFF